MMPETPHTATLQKENRALQQRVAQLEQEARRFRLLVEQSDDLITQVTPDGTFTYINAAAERFLGLPAAHYIGTSAFDVIHPDDREATRQAFMAWVQQGEQSATFENRLVGQRGTVTPVLWTINLHYDEQGTLAYINSICRDMSEHHEQEAQRSQHRDLLQGILDNAPFGVFAVDKEGRNIMCNREAAGNLGLAVEDVLGKTDEDIFPPDVAAANKQKMQHVLTTGELLTYEFDLPADMGPPQSFVHHWFPVTDAAGNHYAVCGVINNITERKQSEQALRESETWLRQIMNSFPDSLVVIEQGHLIDTNQATSTMLGYTIDELQGKPVLELVAPEALEVVKERMAMNNSGHYDAALRRKDGTTIPVDITARDIIYRNRNVRLAIVRDITERKQVEADLHQSRGMLQLVIDHLPQGVFWKDRDLRFLGCNQRLVESAGLTSREDIIGKTDNDMPWREQASAFQADDRDVMSSGIARINYEEALPGANGTVRWMRTSKIPLQHNGKVVAILGLFEDITGHRQQEEELRMFQALVENAPGMISVADIDGRYHYFNPAFRKRLGIPPDALPQTYQIADMSPPEITEELGRTLIPHIMEQGFWKGRSVFCALDGSRFPGDLAVFVTRDKHGNPQQFIAIANDITDQVAAEEERVALQQQVIDAQRDALRELSTPLIPITDEVVIMPLIGTIDSARAQQVMEALLEGVAEHRASLVILDITGVSVVDTQVAQAFIQAAQAVKLLGAQVMLTGIQPQIAQTLVTLGVDLSGIETRGSLQAGIIRALQNA